MEIEDAVNKSHEVLEYIDELAEVPESIVEAIAKLTLYLDDQLWLKLEMQKTRNKFLRGAK